LWTAVLLRLLMLLMLYLSAQAAKMTLSVQQLTGLICTEHTLVVIACAVVMPAFCALAWQPLYIVYALPVLACAGGIALVWALMLPWPPSRRGRAREEAAPRRASMTTTTTRSAGRRRSPRRARIDTASASPRATGDSSSECIICFDAPRGAALNCGHASFCYECAWQMIGRPCPVCRAPVTDALRLFGM
jgi:hypothetical protein